MRPLVNRIAFVASLFFAAPLLAQGGSGVPGGPPARPPMMGAFGGMGAASKLLSRTGELQLTDQQVVRLAAIARREGARRRALRSSIDSVRRAAPMMRRDSAGPRRMAPQLTNALTQMREQSRVDLRDAITVLTPDQQAQAWQMMAARSAMARGAMRRRAMGGMMQRQRMGFAPRTGPNGMRPAGPVGGGAALQRGRVGRPAMRPPEEAPPA